MKADLLQGVVIHKRLRAERGQERAPNLVLNEAIPADVLASIDDPARLSPMLAGASCIRSKAGKAQLVVRTAGEDIEVPASTTLLDQVFELCDGTRTVAEILERIPSSERTEFAEFLNFLLAEGALIDANLASAHAARYAFQFSPFGLAAPSQVTDQICRRFLWNTRDAVTTLPSGTVKVQSVPLQALFDRRVTSYTFDDKTISMATLHKLLWSLAGVVRVKHPRVGHVTPQRTLASAGGMHLVKVFVVLQRKVGRYASGVYRVHYPGERALHLEKINDQHGLVPLAFGKPWELRFATGAVFLAADPVVAAMRYRSRSLQYLFMEAGAALHNGALSADALGLGYATIGGYYERPIARMCSLGRQLVLGTAIFGAKPTAKQVALIARSPDIDFAWVNGESARYSMSFYLARAKVKTPGDDRPHTWGRGIDPWLAMRKAIAEAVERDGFREPRNIVQGKFSQVREAIEPHVFVRYSDTQYQLPNFFYQPFVADQEYPWAQAQDLVTGKPVRVLAELVFSRVSLAASGYTTERPYTQATSSGCAAGTTKEDATLRALLEVIERDAFMRHWLAQQPGHVAPMDQAPVTIAARLAALAAIGTRICIQRLSSDWAQVALVSAQHETLHFTTLGTAAGMDFTQCVDSALDEVEARVYAWIHGHVPSIRHLSEVATTEHHFELYGLKAYYRKADRVLFPAQADTLARWPRRGADQSLQQMVARFASAGIHPIAADITPVNCYIDQGRTQLHVIKALIPGLLPISFGYQREPLGMASRFHPGSKFPHPFP